MSNLDPKDREVLDNFKGMSVGRIFSRARESQGLDIEQIAGHLNIGTPHLVAIESDDKDSLPPQVYAVGFVRAYADVLGLDSEKMAYLFKVQSYGVKQTEEQKTITVRRQGETVNVKTVLSQKIGDNKDSLRDGGVLLMVFVCLGLLVWGIISLFTGGGDAESAARVPAVSEMIPDLETDLTDGADSAAIETEGAPDIAMEAATEPVEAVMPPEEPIEVIVRPDEGRIAYGADMLESNLAFKAVEQSWTEIRSVQSGDVLLTRTLEPGDVFYTPPGIDVLLTTGNAGGIEVFLDGRSLGLLGRRAEIVRLRPFSVEAMRLQNLP